MTSYLALLFAIVGFIFLTASVADASSVCGQGQTLDLCGTCQPSEIAELICGCNDEELQDCLKCKVWERDRNSMLFVNLCEAIPSRAGKYRRSTLPAQKLSDDVALHMKNFSIVFPGHHGKSMDGSSGLLNCDCNEVTTGRRREEKREDTASCVGNQCGAPSNPFDTPMPTSPPPPPPPMTGTTGGPPPPPPTPTTPDGEKICDGCGDPENPFESEFSESESEFSEFSESELSESESEISEDEGSAPEGCGNPLNPFGRRKRGCIPGRARSSRRSSHPKNRRVGQRQGAKHVSRDPVKKIVAPSIPAFVHKPVTSQAGSRPAVPKFQEPSSRKMRNEAVSKPQEQDGAASLGQAVAKGLFGDKVRDDKAFLLQAFVLLPVVVASLALISLAVLAFSGRGRTPQN